MHFWRIFRHFIFAFLSFWAAFFAEVLRRVAERLQAARDKAAAEVEAVLKGLVQLRVQLGLVALAGETGPVRDRLMELSARLTALEEVAPCG